MSRFMEGAEDCTHDWSGPQTIERFWEPGVVDDFVQCQREPCGLKVWGEASLTPPAHGLGLEES